MADVESGSAYTAMQSEWLTIFLRASSGRACDHHMTSESRAALRASSWTRLRVVDTMYPSRYQLLATSSGMTVLSELISVVYDAMLYWLCKVQGDNGGKFQYLLRRGDE
ncbi:hypothetical protein BN1708_008364 [Verticillium longisporum]|uniref:Uncharacterized protein n=1 Tax=Verticillium longisporum TaxID=100787 RepID=A0A0G4N2T6_VERLO|nr:hypothetical protein BN1708_008364 [Verticillium longisporum]